MEQQNQALNVLVNAVRLAQKRGAFNLDEAAVIGAAVSVFAGPQSEVAEVTTDQTVVTTDQTVVTTDQTAETTDQTVESVHDYDETKKSSKKRPGRSRK
jgi:DUF1009 family protein